MLVLGIRPGLSGSRARKHLHGGTEDSGLVSRHDAMVPAWITADALLVAE